jgi:hypothetical protein
MASNSASASEVAKAVNAFLGFSSGDQQALLEVIEDYFASPADAEEEDDLEEDDSCIPGSAQQLRRCSNVGHTTE